MAEVIRVGSISSIDYEAGLVRVAYHDKDDSVTQPLPMLADRYFMPKVGDQVLVLHLSNGTEAGVVLGRYWNDNNIPKESGEDLFRMDMDREGTAFIKYLNGVITVHGNDIVLDGDIEIKGELKVNGTIKAKDVEVSNDIIVGGISFKNHTHTCTCGISSGKTSAPVK